MMLYDEAGGCRPVLELSEAIYIVYRFPLHYRPCHTPLLNTKFYPYPHQPKH